MVIYEIEKVAKTEQALFWGTLVPALFVVGYALLEVTAFGNANFVILTASAFVAILASKFNFGVPGTLIRFRPTIVLTFWGTMWLGIPGGILLGAISAISEQAERKRSGRASVFSVAIDTIAAFASSAVYSYAVANYGSQPSTVALIPNEVIIASILMASVHFAVGAAMTIIEFGIHDNKLRSSNALEIIAVSARAYLLAVLAAIVLYLTFRHFGVEFGLVVIPLVVVGHIAYRMHIRSLEQKTKQITEASRMHLATVEALATAIDARDQVGIGHVRRTQIYAVGIGRALGLSDGEISALRTGALLHDIGKLAVPDHILNKPGRLSPAEIEKTKIHSSVGASILEKVGFSYPVVPTVKYHHEHWDGNGYPEGLKGANIPVTARILTIADTYDTLRGDRPYRRAISREEACDFLRSKAGSQFDPSITDLFFRNLRVFEAEIEADGLNYEDMDQTAAVGSAVMHESSNPNYVEQIKRANHEVFTLYSLAREFSGSLNLGETLSLFTRKVGEFVPFDTCVVYLIEDTGETAKAALAVGKHETLLRGKRIKVGEGATGYVLKKMKPVENVDPALDFAFSNLEIGRDFTAMMSIPLIADGELVGAISLYSCRLTNYQDEHLRLLDTVSKIAADAIEKALKHAEAQVYALTDSLTALPNARSLRIEFEKEKMRAGRGGTSFQLLVLDLDGFKSVNDTFGHKVGDDLLKEIAGVIRGQLREYDFLARYGGDEFVAIIPETDTAYVERLRHRIEDAVGSHSMPAGDGLFARVGVSFGSASFPAQGDTFDQLIVLADKAMYRTKAINRLRDTSVTVVYPDEVMLSSERFLNAPDDIDDKKKARAPEFLWEPSSETTQADDKDKSICSTAIN